MTSTPSFRLKRDAHGRLRLHLPDRDDAPVCTPVRAFPIAAPDEGLSLVGEDGHELRWIERLSSLPGQTRTLLEEDLALREFAPIIERIVSVSSFSTPSVWQLETDRGPTELLLDGEEHIRRLAHGALLIADSRGVQFRVRDRFALDKGSRRLLERFL